MVMLLTPFADLALLPFAFAARFARLLRICVIVSILEHKVGEARLCREGVCSSGVSRPTCVPTAGVQSCQNYDRLDYVASLATVV